MTRSIGRKLAEAGQNDALAHAQDVNGKAWKDHAMEYLDIMAMTGNEFRIEQVRELAEANGLPQAPSNRAWGAIASAAQRSGRITRVRWEACENSKAHCAPVSVWRGVPQ